MLRPEVIFLNWLLALPFFAALCAELFPRLSLRAHSEREAAAMERGPFWLGTMASFMGLALSVSLISTVRLRPLTSDYWWTRDFYHLRFQADLLSIYVVLLLNMLALFMHLHLAGIRDLSYPHHRAALMLAAQGSASIAALGADLIVLALFLDLTLVCIWLLAFLDAPSQANWFLKISYSAGLLLFLGILLLWKEAADSSMAQGQLPMLVISSPPASLRIIGVLIILGLLPRIVALPAHGWLGALTEKSLHAALFAGILLPVLATYTLLRLLPGTLLLATIPGVGRLLAFLGLISLLWSALRALLVREMKQLAVWLIVVQAGLFLLALSAVADPRGTAQATQAAALQMMLAPLALLAIWSAVIVVKVKVGTDALPGLSGLFRVMPAAGITLLLGGLSTAGLPGLPGYQVQRLLIAGLLAAGRIGSVIIILLADLAIAVAVIRVFWRAFLREEPPPFLRPASSWLSVQLVLLVIALILLGLWMQPLAGWSEAVFRSVLSISP